MRIVHDDDEIRLYMRDAVKVSGDNPVLIDYYLQDATEVDVDALADGKDVHVAGIMEHIEEAGIHSGDSACSLPPFSLPAATIEEIKIQTRALAKGLNVKGLMNVQFAVKDGVVYVLEVNPRASRTVPFVAKATGVPVAKIASRIMAGETLASFGLVEKTLKHVAVKEAVFPFARFPGVDIILGPEMKSTGEVMGLDSSFPIAYAKSQMASGTTLPLKGAMFISVKDRDKPAAYEVSKRLAALGFEIIATRGTGAYLESRGLKVGIVNKVLEGRPHCVDAMLSGQVQFVVNTTDGSQALEDSFSIRRTALVHGIAHYTTLTGARAAASAIEALSRADLAVQPLQAYFKP
jgi:carbamoyl-phosphate synthase large subunit